MPLTTVFAAKELQPQTYQPILLAQFQFLDGSYLYLSTHPLNTAEGGYQYGGNNYLARIDKQDIAAMQQRSEQGIDRIPSVTVHLHDSDRTLYTNYETVANKGFKGAILTLTLIFWSADTATFSSDSLTPFIGICDAPQIVRSGRGDLLAVTATSSHNMARSYLPVFHVQQRCGNIFPATAAQRLAGATDMSSSQWGCGYNPDQVGTDPEIGGDCRRGNLNAGVPYTTCNYTKSDCIARGMYSADGSARATGRFNGIQFAPRDRETRSKSYLEGKTISVLNARNDAIYSESFPMLYGTQWVKPIVTNILGDGNSTRVECVICQDDIGTDGIVQVVVNGIIIPRNGSSPDNKLFRWNFVGDPSLGTTLHSGTRNGVATKDALYDQKGDPYGGLAAIEVVVYRQIAESGSAPNVMILAQGPKIKTPNTALSTDQASWPKVRTTNPAFVLLDVLIWSNWRYSEIDLQSFIDAAPYCDASVTYTDLNGSSSTHPRYRTQFVLDKRRTAAEVVQALCRSFNAQLVRNPSTGLLQLFIRRTLADQQPATISGSNYSTAVSSKTAPGVVTNGYVAYKFDESTIARENPDDPPFLPMHTDASAQTPNKITFPFQDEDNSYAQDSITVLDVDAINRAGGYQGGQEIVEQLNVIGVSNFDQAARIANITNAERLRGNQQGDPRGTQYFEIRSNFRAVHLRVGHLCLLSWQAYGISNQLVRIIKIQPGENFESATITAAWHSDDWYTDAFGQQPAPLNSDPRRARPNRKPYPWQPYGAQPITGDSVFGTPPTLNTGGYNAGSWWGFGVSQAYDTLGDGTSLGKVSLTGCPPVNNLSTPGTGGTQPPLMGIQGSTASTGGTIPGGIELLLAIAAIDGTGKLTSLSKIVKIAIPSGTNTNTVTTPAISWQGGSVGYILYAGTDELNLSQQAGNNASTPGSITIASLNYETYGPPDILADTVHFRAKRVIHLGCWGDVCTAVAANTLTFAPPLAFTLNQFANYDLMLVARGQGVTTAVPIANFRVSANTTGGAFTVSPDPVAAGVVAGDVFVMLFRPSTITGTTIADANLVNPYAPAGLVVNAEIGNTLRIFAGTGIYGIRTITANDATSVTLSQAWDLMPDNATRFSIEEPGWQYDVDIERVTATAPAPSPAPLVAKVNIDNYRGQTIMIQANVDDADGNGSIEPFAPCRFLYIWGTGINQRTVTANTSITATDQEILCDTTAGPITVTLLPSSAVSGRQFIVVKITADANAVTVKVASSGTILTRSGVVSSTALSTQGDSVLVVSNG